MMDDPVEPEEKAPVLALIAAVAENGCIGIGNKLPWYLPEDLKFFKRVTTGKPVIMGRNTFESLGKPLPNRTNIVITRNPGYTAPDGVKVVGSLDHALAVAEAVAHIAGLDEIMVIGGAQIYAEALPRIGRMYLTEVKKTVDGDAFFPAWNRSEWREVAREAQHYEPAQTDYSFVIYERR
ncbi:MAG: dihydrofolate reductase [Moraxellaceae bacterium]|jgi:dihydrofolate reductase|nr:dihydrofolate reductase [Moraxellaceae bacterium]